MFPERASLFELQIRGYSNLILIRYRPNMWRQCGQCDVYQRRICTNVSGNILIGKDVFYIPFIYSAYPWHIQHLLSVRFQVDNGVNARNLKVGIGFLFYSCVNAMGWRSYYLSRMEVSYCTFGFGAIIRCDLPTLSLPRDSPRDNQYACEIWVHVGKATHA